MVKVTLLRLPDAVGEEIEKIAKVKGIPFATAAKELICELINKNAPAEPSKAPAGTAANQV